MKEFELIDVKGNVVYIDIDTFANKMEEISEIMALDTLEVEYFIKCVRSLKAKSND